MLNARLLGDVSIGQMHTGKQGFGLLVDLPTDDSHLSGIPKPLVHASNLVLLMGPMNQVMARAAERDQILRPVSSRLSGFDVVDRENGVL